MCLYPNSWMANHPTRCSLNLSKTKSQKFRHDDGIKLFRCTWAAFACFLKRKINPFPKILLTSKKGESQSLGESWESTALSKPRASQVYVYTFEPACRKFTFTNDAFPCAYRISLKFAFLSNSLLPSDLTLSRCKRGVCKSGIRNKARQNYSR